MLALCSNAKFKLLETFYPDFQFLVTKKVAMTLMSFANCN